MFAFDRMMETARFEDAYAQALAINQDAIKQGVLEPAFTGAVSHSLTAMHLRDVREMKRLREQNYLAAMMQVNDPISPSQTNRPSSSRTRLPGAN